MMRGISLLTALLGVSAVIVACSGSDTTSLDCGVGSLVCGDACVRVASDNRHCGNCGTACALTERCTSGKCTSTCGAGMLSCGGGCVDPSVDRENCGGCGARCASGQLCAAGACTTTCPTSTTRCELVPNEAFCANLLGDDHNCGQCGRACSGAATCVLGACVPPCAEGETRCGLDCVHTESSWKHCGQCGNSCGSGRQCRDYQCADTGNIVFITSTQSDGKRGGLAGADATCQSLATAAGLGGTFRAWLSDNTGSPSTRFPHSSTKYALVDGTVIANDWADLTDGTLLHAINLDERGKPGPSACLGTCDLYVHSNTTIGGGLFTINHSCDNWTSNAKSSQLALSVGSRADALWTGGGTADGGCDWKLAIYCFQQ